MLKYDLLIIPSRLMAFSRVIINSETYVIRPYTNFKLSNMFIDFVRVSKDITQELIGLKSRDFHIKLK